MSGQQTRHASKKYLMLKPGDSVALALEPLEVGDSAKFSSIQVRIAEPIEFGHKFAARGIKKGENILKHGEVIGRATRDIKAGEHVHVHNIESLRARREK